jgi:arylsulfatase A-like enzyme
MVVQGDYKLIVYPAIGRTLLFNLKEDPLEEHDLAGDPAQAGRIEELMGMLARLQTETGDTLVLSER